jgi:hypothetical protein
MDFAPYLVLFGVNLPTLGPHPKSFSLAWAAVYTDLWILFKLLGFAPLPPKFGGN